MNVKLALGMEIATYPKLLDGKKNQLESGMQNMSIQTKTTSSYSGGLSLAYQNLDYALGFQANLSSCRGSGSFGCISTTSSKTVAVRKVETCNGKLVFLSHLMSCPSENYCSPSCPPSRWEWSCAGEPWAQETHLRLSPSPQLTLGMGEFTAWGTTSYPCPQLKAKSGVSF